MQLSEDDLRELQQIILIIVEYFDQFCQDHGIEYYLMGGTALGAIRHRGFIPWDDDFDVFMDSDNYARFLDAADQFLDQSKFYLQREDTEEWPLFFSKLRLNGTAYLELDNQGRDMHQGIFIDIMCLNNAFSNRILRFGQYLSGRVLLTYALAKRGYVTRSLWRKIALSAAKALVRPFIKRWLIRLVRCLNAKSALYVGHFFGRASFGATAFEKSFLAPAKRVCFETLELPVPAAVDRYLAVRFGPNYMSPPTRKDLLKYPIHALGVDFGRWRA